MTKFVKTYEVFHTAPNGMVTVYEDEFTRLNADSVNSVLYAQGIPIEAANELINMWNLQSNRMGGSYHYQLS